MEKRLEQEIERLCREYAACCVEVERREEANGLKKKIGELCEIAREGMDIGKPGMLVALMDAYEVTRDEEMLQEVLDVVSGNAERLEVAVINVRLLAYCYYYVEEEECAVRAREMVEMLKRKGVDVTEAEKIMTELTENF